MPGEIGLEIFQRLERASLGITGAIWTGTQADWNASRLERKRPACMSAKRERLPEKMNLLRRERHGV